MTTGKINIHTENIFPIIKKFLYSDHEIFMRELVSNAVDATQKLKTLAGIGEFKDELGDLAIKVTVDKEAKTITISDSGIGMTADEVEKYINQIAFSSAEEFVNKYKDKKDAANIIGHFGLGFYSSFMVASRVEIFTKTHKKGKGTKAMRWECDGSPEYKLEETEKKTRGTDVVLHINDDSIEFLENNRIQHLLTKYCKFLPVPISFGDEIINDVAPAWTRKPAELNDEDYNTFYKKLYPFADDPMFHIHLNVDYPFNLTGILYFPKIKRNIDLDKNKIQLYSNQVFVTDSVEGIVPEFLTMLHGVIDSPDIPLNVSRSYLQSDAAVKKIASHISKKVADKLEELFKDNREEFEKKWDDISVFIKYGMLSDEKFYERAAKFCLLKNTDGKYYTIDEFKEAIKPFQTDKEEKTVFIYTNTPTEHHGLVAQAKEKGYQVVVMDGQLDSHFVNQLEQKTENAVFARIDSDTMDNIVKKDEERTSVLSQKELDELKPLFENNLDKEKFDLQVEHLESTEPPAIIIKPEFMRRMKDMAAMGGGMDFMGAMPEKVNLVVNSNHALISKLLKEKDEASRTGMIKQITDLAMLSQNMLKGKELSDFINRSLSLIQ